MTAAGTPSVLAISRDRMPCSVAVAYSGPTTSSPACVRKSPGKEDGCSLKPFATIQRVQLPPGKGAARQPEASLAWAAVTPLVKRRQQTLKPWVSPDIMSRWSLRSVGTGDSIDRTASGEVLPVRPGSWNRAKVWDGLPGNLRDPVRVLMQPAGQGNPAHQRPQARGWFSAASGAPRRARSMEKHEGPRTEAIRDGACAHGKS